MFLYHPTPESPVKKITVIASILWLVAIVWLHTIDRSDFNSLWAVYSIAFASYAWLVFSKNGIGIYYGFGLAVLARIASLFFEPLLSNDFYRYIWDGMMMYEGIHPMAYTPSYVMDHPEILSASEHLFSLLNSPDYFSVYPPIAQWMFHLSYSINGLHIEGHILFYKSLLICTDALIVYFLYRLLSVKNLPVDRVLWFALNPLIILEYTGNLHFDGLMIAGLLGAVLLSEKKTVLWSSVLMAASVLSKMVTLILIPFMPQKLYWKNITVFSVLSVGITVLVFIWSFDANTGWIDSVRLWFTSFEFNASFYYLVRGAGYLVKGYNAIEIIGPILLSITLVGIGILWWKYIRKTDADWAQAMLFVMTLYFLMSTTVHPWYIGLLVALSVVSRKIYPFVWSYLIFLSYSHYDGGGFAENYSLIATEYILLVIWMFVEWRWGKYRNTPGVDPIIR
jgi:alpha-1,6-mannosyltransferase